MAPDSVFSLPSPQDWARVLVYWRYLAVLVLVGYRLSQGSLSAEEAITAFAMLVFPTTHTWQTCKAGIELVRNGNGKIA